MVKQIIISSRLVRLFSLGFFLLLFTLSLSKLPFPFPYEMESMGSFLISIYAIHYVFQRFFIRGLQFSSFELYILLLMFVPVASGFLAYRTFGQPVLYGILAQRWIWMVAASLLLLQLLRTYRISLDDLCDVLIFFAWASLILLVILKNTTDFEAELSTDRSRFRLQTYFISFGFLYYAVVLQTTFKRKYLLFVVLFLLYIVLINGSRSLLVALVSAFVLLSLAELEIQKAIIRLIILIVIVSSCVGLFYLIDTTAFYAYVNDLESALIVFFTGTESGDTSADSRLRQIALIWPYVAEYWVLGSGWLSNQWRGGFDGMFGHVYPTDVGWLGVVFVYGIVGWLFLHIQYLFAIKYAYSKGYIVDPLFLRTTKVFIVYYFIHSIVTGRTFDLSASLIIITMLYYNYEVTRYQFQAENNV